MIIQVQVNPSKSNKVVLTFKCDNTYNAKNSDIGSVDGYRFGFNGKPSDNVISGNGNIFDYGFRIYNPRVGRFLSVDPLSKSYPYYSPFQFAGNKPIIAVDLDGLEEFYSITGKLIGVGDPNNKTKLLVITKTTQKAVKKMSSEQRIAVFNNNTYWDIVYLPTPQIMETINTTLEQTASSGTEHGFVIGTDNNGDLVTSTVIASDEVSEVSNDPAYEELEQKGVKTAINVHSHGKQYTDLGDEGVESTQAVPSTKGGNGGGDIGSHKRRLEKGQITQASWVIGWVTTKIVTETTVTGTPLEKPIVEFTQVPTITFYTDKQQVSISIKELTKIVDKIYGKTN